MRSALAATALGLAATMAAVAARPARAGARPRYGGELRVLLPSSPAVADPARATSAAELTAARALHATLLDDDERGALRPALLESLPEAEDGGRAWRLRLAAELRFQDGQPVTAADVAASLARLGGPVSAHAWLVSAIDGAAAVREGRAAQLAGVQVLSDRELRVVLSYAFPRFPEALAALPAAIVRAGPGGALVGAGPFQSDGPTDAGLRLVSFDGFHGGRPYADALHLAGADARVADRGLTAGSSDAALRAEPHGASLRLEVPPRGVVLALVSRRLGPAAEPTRRALAALDRRELARLVVAPVVPLAALLPPALLPASASRTQPRDGGAPAGKLTLLLPDGPDAPRAAAARIQVKLYDRGVRVAIEAAPAATFASRVASGDFDAALVPIWLVSPEPALALAQVAAATGGWERGARALSQAAAAEPSALPGLAAALEADLLAVPLYAAGLRLSAREGVEGWHLHQDGTPELGDVWLAPRLAGRGGSR